jgi:hypothetical protein
VSESESRCANCGGLSPASALDADGWCDRCRKVVVRRATIAARAVAVVAVLLSGWLLFAVIQPGARSLILWILFLAAVCFVLYRLTRRVAFELVRSRGVPPPRDPR